MFIMAFTPIVATSFPVLTPIIIAAAGALGYKMLTDMKDTGGKLNKELKLRLEQSTNIQLKLDETVLENLDLEVGADQSLFFEQDGITLAVTKDVRGKLRITVTGAPGTDADLLEEKGREFARELAQLFALNRAIQSFERLNAEIVEEEVTDEGEIRLRFRRWT